MHRGLRQQEGFTVVLAIVVLLIGLLVTTALIGQSVATGGSVNRDGASNRAVQAALAGAQLGESTLMSTVTTTWSDSGQCASAPGAPELVRDSTTGWCMPSAPLEVGANESVRYAISPQYSVGTQTAHDVIAIGTAAGVSRRVRQRVEAYDARTIFGQYAIVSDESLELSSNDTFGTSDLNANIRSNGDVKLDSNVTVCGDITPGVTNTVSIAANAGLCDGDSVIQADAPIALPPPDLSAVRTANDNANLPSSAFDGKTLNVTSSLPPVAGNTFVLCYLQVSSGATLTLQSLDATKAVRIFIDDPSHCGSTVPGVSMASNSHIQIQGAGSTYPFVQILMAGSGSIDISSNGDFPAEVYAPLASVSFSSHNNQSTTNNIGGIVGKSVTFSSNVNVYPLANPGRLDFDTTPPQPTAGAFSECPSAATFPDDPGSGC